MKKGSTRHPALLTPSAESANVCTARSDNMDPLKRRPRLTQAAGVLTAIILACALAAVQIVTAQAGDHWVGTWATATVGRPQARTQPAGGGGGRGRGRQPPGFQNQCP